MASSITVIIETPKDSRLKFKLDPSSGLYKVDRVLAMGLRFPLNFGFIPDTCAEDGDPTDVLLILDENLFPGCGIDCNLIGVIEAEQTEKGETYRNDRILAVPSKDQNAPRSTSDLSQNFVSDIARFFATYHEAEGNTFKTLGLAGPDQAQALLKRTRLPQTAAHT